jgi:hypothetical protein
MATIIERLVPLLVVGISYLRHGEIRDVTDPETASDAPAERA